MREKDVVVGRQYAVRVSGTVQVVRVDGWRPPSSFSPRRRWYGTNVATGRQVAGTAARLRYEVKTANKEES